MKQSAAKTLGVAALGAAFAAVGAGAANAAPAAPDAGKVLGSVSRALPTEEVSKTLPQTGQALDQAGPTVKKGLDTAQPVAREALGNDPAKSATGLLGGLPVHGTPVNGLSLR
ncbi:ATP-binding protein [Streptomyces thermoalcalitolerans]|uniref:ATP-binding protein n=1 Tax=Streptomyces thermoalcalitolerans TaxID=65605 RepID=A0ABP3Z913_9ACTN